MLNKINHTHCVPNADII